MCFCITFTKNKRVSIIEQLEEEKRFLLERLEFINKSLSIHGKSVVPFPKNSRKDKKVLWIIKEHFSRGIKFIDIQDKYNELNGLNSIGNEEKIDNTVRILRRDKKLVMVKYNNSNKLSFWGLSEWVNENDFKEEFKPKEEFLPIEIKSIEIIR